MPRLALCVVAALLFPGCPVTMDRGTTMPRLAQAIGAEVTDAEVLENHNQLVEDIVRSGVMEGMFESEVTEAIGRGEDCGTRSLCRDHGFRPEDWTYEVGHAPGDPSLPAGPTLVVGFDRTGRVINTYYTERRGAEAHR